MRRIVLHHWIISTLAAVMCTVTIVLVALQYGTKNEFSYPFGKHTLLQLSQLGMACESYSTLFGESPPMTWGADLRDHVSRTLADPEQFYRNLESRKLVLEDLDPEESLVLWLGGIPAEAGSKELQPLVRRNKGPIQLFEFKQELLVDRDNDGWLEYAICRDGKCISFSRTSTGPIVIDEETLQSFSYAEIVRQAEEQGPQ